MARTYNRKTQENTSKYVKSARVYLAERSGTAYGAFSRWESTKSTKITQEEEEFSEIDDSGQRVVFDTTVTGVMGEGQLLTRGQDVRLQFVGPGASADQSFRDKYFCAVIVGAALDNGSGTTVSEVWVFPKVRFSQAFDYELGGEGKFNYKFVALKNDTGADLTVPLPSGMTGANGWDLTTTGSVTVKTDEFFYTADVA